MWCEAVLLVLVALVVTEAVTGAAGGSGGRVPVMRHLVKVDPLPLASEGGGGG